MVYTEICNAVWMYLWVGALLLAVILQCLVFMKKAWKHALELGLRPEQIKKGLTTGITISIMPTLPVLLVLLSLMPLLGVPLPWLRLSIIGSAYYETYAATTALECVGETMKLNEYSAVGWQQCVSEGNQRIDRIIRWTFYPFIHHKIFWKKILKRPIKLNPCLPFISHQFRYGFGSFNFFRKFLFQPVNRRFYLFFIMLIIMI